jgi:hypothetical protein
MVSPEHSFWGQALGGGLAGWAAHAARRRLVSELDADCPRDRRGVGRLCLADTIMRRDSLYYLSALVGLVIMLGWVLFVMFAG